MGVDSLGAEFFKPKPQLVEEIVDDWPKPMEPDAFTGLAGDFVRLMESHTEADPHALLAIFLISSGVLFGREAWCAAEARKHYPVEFVLMVGNSGTSRKGSAQARTESVLGEVDPFFTSRKLSGFSSGEGLIEAVSTPKNPNAIPGLSEAPRSFLGILQEFGSLLGVMKREGNVMSAIIRQAWDCERLRTMTRKNPLDVDNVNVSLIGHITSTELLNGLTSTERMNGFANRFLILRVRRSKFLPEGGGDVNISAIASRLRAAVSAAEGRGFLERDPAARALWGREYMRLTAERPGLFGALCSRAEAHTLRLSLLYALLDQADSVRVEHLRAALAFWDYCERSAQHVFGSATGDAEADKIINALASGPCTLTDFHRLFANHRTTDWILAKLAELTRAGRIAQTMIQGSRRESVTAWSLK